MTTRLPRVEQLSQLLRNSWDNCSTLDFETGSQLQLCFRSGTRQEFRVVNRAAEDLWVNTCVVKQVTLSLAGDVHERSSKSVQLAMLEKLNKSSTLLWLQEFTLQEANTTDSITPSWISSLTACMDRFISDPFKRSSTIVSLSV